MSIELDWQIVDKDVPEAEQPLPPSPPPRRRRLPRKTVLAVGLGLLLVIAAVAAYVAWTWRTQLDRATQEVRPIAKLEAQAIAANDLQSFMALQDPEDSTWRDVQEKRFRRLESIGLPEFGWKAMGIPPQPGHVSLEPGGARLDVSYRFSVTEPMPGGPTSITLSLPQYYKQTPSGWVRASPSVEYWGTWRTRSGKLFAMLYVQRDASLLEPLIPWMDRMLSRVCGPLPCPPQPIYVIFENSPGSLASLSDFSYGFDDGAFTLRLPSPQLTGLPADDGSRDELYRAIGTRVVQALIYAASGRHLNLRYLSSQSIVRWGLAQAGLAGPLVTPELTRTLGIQFQTTLQPLSTIPLGPQSGEGMLPLALSFVEERLGHGSAMRLIPAMGTSRTLGEAISATLRVRSTALEPAWQAYLRRQVNLPAPSAPLPSGELALECATDDSFKSSIWRVRTDGTGLTQIVTSTEARAWWLSWSPDGKWLAYLQNDRVGVIDATGQQVKTVLPLGLFGWLPGDRLWIMPIDESKSSDQLVNLETGDEIELDVGKYHTWSPDGTRVAYFVMDRITSTVWVADADGQNARPIGTGYNPAWSPDNRRLAFLGDLRPDPVEPVQRPLSAMEIQVADIASGQVTTLARRGDVLRSLGEDENRRNLGDMVWSPDGKLIALTLWPTGGESTPSSLLVVLDAETGTVRTHWHGKEMPLPLSWTPHGAWSADSHYLTFLAGMGDAQGKPLGEVGILDVQTGNYTAMPMEGFWDRSPDGKWLAAPQGEGGVLLSTLDLSATYRLNIPNCTNVAWRP